MKYLLCILLIVWMGSYKVKEIDMALRRNVPMQDQVIRRPVRTGTMPPLSPPAWLGNASGNLGYSGPANTGYQEPLSNTGRTDRRVKDDNPMTMGNMLPGGSGAPVIQNAPSLPAWMNNPPGPAYGGGYNPTNLNSRPPQRPPAYGGIYNPTNMQTTPGQWSVPAWLGGDADIRDIPSLVNPQPEIPTYDLSQTHPSAYGAILPLQVPQPQPVGGGGGFGSSYGGNWRPRGGGGYGGYGGDGYGGYTPPAWLADMGLYSWKFG